MTKATQGFRIVLVLCAAAALPAHAQQLLDRVVARVGTTAVTQTDVEAALAFGVVDARAPDPLAALIDRRLMLAEVARFPPPEPAAAAVAELVAAMKAAAGGRAPEVMARTGVDEARLSELARETLRLRGYVQQRFGSGPRSAEQMARWLDDLRSRGDVARVSAPR